MARMMNSVMFHRNYCHYGCCSSLPLWSPKTRKISRRIQRSREKFVWKREANAQD